MKEENQLRNKVSRNFIWRFLERCGAQGVTFIVSIILARILDPDIYGTVALVTVFTSILQVFVDSGLGNALIQKKDADDIDFSTVFYVNIIVSLVLYCLVFFSAPLIATFYENQELVPLIRVLSLTLIISGIKNIQQAYVSKKLLFKKFFYSTLGGTILSAMVSIWMAYHGYGVWALVVQNVLNQFVDTLILWLVVDWRPCLVFSMERLTKMFSFGWKMLVSHLITVVYQELRTLIIGKKYSSADLAYYNRSMQFPKLIISNINSSIDSILLPVMANEQDKINRVREMMRRSIKISSFIIWPAMMGMAGCAETLVKVVLTEKWLPCVFYMRIFCVTHAFYPIDTANLSAIKAMGRSDLYLKYGLIKKGIGMSILIISSFFGVKAIALSALLSSVISQFINAWPNKKILKYSYFEQIKDIAPYVFLSLGMFVVVYIVGFLDCSDGMLLLIQVVCGIIIYVVGAKILKFESLDYCISLVKGLFKREK